MRGQRIALAVAVLALVLSAAACQKPASDSGIATAGGAAAGTAAGGAAAPGGDGAVDDAKWVRCLRDQGLEVTYPDPAVGDKPQINERSVAPEKLSTAVRACQRFNPNYGRKPPPMDPTTLERWRQFARCMRANGVNMPDPDPGASRPPVDFDPKRDRAARDRLVDATTICSKQVPGLVTISNEGSKGDKK